MQDLMPCSGLEVPFWCSAANTHCHVENIDSFLNEANKAQTIFLSVVRQQEGKEGQTGSQLTL